MDNSFILDYKLLTPEQKKGIYFIVAAILFKYVDTLLIFKLPTPIVYFYIDYYIHHLIKLVLIIFGIKKCVIKTEGEPYTLPQKTGIILLMIVILIPASMKFLSSYDLQSSIINYITTIYYELPVNFISSIVLGFLGIKFLIKKENTENEYITDWTYKK